MADFFTRLAERALGAAPVAAPDLPPMFAPAAQTLELSTEVIAPRPSVRETSHVKSSPQNAPVENLPLRQPADPARETPRRDELRPPLVKAPFATNQIDDRGFSIHRAEEISEAAAVARPASDSDFKPRVATDRDDTGSVLRSDPTPHHGAPFAQAPILSTIRAEPVASTIQVTIGRVEVRAITAPAEPARPRERKAPPLLSLDQYLRQRNEGRR